MRDGSEMNKIDTEYKITFPQKESSELYAKGVAEDVRQSQFGDRLGSDFSFQITYTAFAEILQDAHEKGQSYVLDLLFKKRKKKWWKFWA